MLKIYEYECKKLDCSLCSKLIELFIHNGLEDLQRCEHCKKPLFKVLSATKGYVRGTETPCRV